MGTIAVGVVLAGFAVGVILTRVVGRGIREQAQMAERQQDSDALPEQ